MAEVEIAAAAWLLIGIPTVALGGVAWRTVAYIRELLTAPRYRRS